MSETEHDPVKSGRPELDRGDTPDVLHPEADDDRADRKLPPDDDREYPRESRTEDTQDMDEGPSETPAQS